jgi:hydrogenase/urease accessory protein HupE
MSARTLSVAWLRGFALAAGLLQAGLGQAHQASDAYASVRAPSPDTVVSTLAVALNDLDLALPEADADQNRELTWSELQAALPAVKRWVGQHAQFSCDNAEAPSPWVFDALEQRSTGVYARLRTELPCLASAPLALRYTLMSGLDPTHRLIVNADLPGSDMRSSVLASDAPPLALRTGATNGTEATGRAGGWQTFRTFVPEGVHHILTGYDHLAFLLALLLPLSLRYARSAQPARPGLRELLWTVTAFTLGHSVTLILASLGLSAVPSWVEPAISVSIGLSALLNLYPQPWLQPRWLALGFGLIHGLGFANVMKEADLSSAPLAWALAGFNTGVELGQLACVAVWCVLHLVLARWNRYDLVVVRGGSMALIAVAVFWTWERVA